MDTGQRQSTGSTPSGKTTLPSGSSSEQGELFSHRELLWWDSLPLGEFSLADAIAKSEPDKAVGRFLIITSDFDTVVKEVVILEPFRRSGQEDWYSMRKRQLAELESLKQGWDGYNAPAPGSWTTILGQEFLEALHVAGLSPSRLNASVVGGIAFAFTTERREVFVEFYSDHEIYAMFSHLSDPNDDARVVPVAADREELAQLIEEIRVFLYG